MKVMVDDGFPDEPKLIRFAEMLGISEVQAMGHVVSLWCFAMRTNESGRLDNWTDGMLLRKAQWEGDPQKFINALMNCGHAGGTGFIGKDGNGYYVNAWLEWQGSLLRKLQYGRDYMENRRRQEREAKDSEGDVREVPAKRPANVQPARKIQPLPVQPEEIHAPEPPALKSGTPAAELASAYLTQNRGMISQRKATEMVQFYLDRGVPAQGAHVAFMAPECRGKKIWEVLESLPNGKGKNGSTSSVQDALRNWAKEETV